MAILDSTVDHDGGVIHHEVLEANEKGQTPDTYADNAEEIYFRSHSMELIMSHQKYLQV